MLWVESKIDLFACKLNAQLRKFVSWRPDPEASQVDAFMLNWSEEMFYAFLLFCLVNRLFKKIFLTRQKGYWWYSCG